MAFLVDHPGSQIRFRLMRDGTVRYYLEMTLEQWRKALGKYYQKAAGRSWLRHGYIVAITRREAGEYTENFQDRWAAYVRPAR